MSVQKDVACSTNLTCDATADYSNTASGAQDGDTDPKFCYRVILSNTGTVVLNITNVTDNGAINDNDAAQLASDFAGLLVPGQVKTNFYGPYTLTADDTDTVTSLGYETRSCQALPVSASDDAVADVVPSAITCEVRFEQNGQPVSRNDGCGGCEPAKNVVIQASADPVAVIVRVSNPGANDQSVVNGNVSVGGFSANGVGPIASGGFADVTVTNLPGDALGCYIFPATVVFAGEDTDLCPPINTACTNSLEICGTNCIEVVKLVKCVETNECASEECSTDLSQYAPSATGVRDAGFCYGIAIRNCGTLDFTSVAVTDTVLGDISSLFPGGLAAGQSKTNFTGLVSYPNFVGTTNNTVTAEGTNSLGTVSATAQASVELLAPAIVCTKSVTVDGQTYSGTTTIQIPFGSSNDLAFAVEVENTGDVDLENVEVIDTGASGCDPSTNVIAFLASGASTNIELCIITGVSCPPVTSLTNIVNVSAEVSTNVCSIDPFTCERIGVSSACTNVITLTCSQPSACRTTGGGKQIANDLRDEFKQWTCQSTAVSTPSPRYVTHGGQVGAPFAVGAICVTNTPCIRGEWQHVRHIKGGLRGVFHARSNGRVHEFDSLGCACLPCPELADVVTSPSPGLCSSGSTPVSLDYTNELAVTEGKRHELCNAGERVCGPEPRRAPANKIAFSGVGDYALTKGKKEKQSVVFRVDIEDRSEPGGNHPGGATPPPDRYRIRIWFLKGNEGGASGSPTTTAALQLRCGVAVKDPLLESVDACRPPDIDDGGALDRGNRQIHPPTGATPPADCGAEISPGSCD